MGSLDSWLKRSGILAFAPSIPPLSRRNSGYKDAFRSCPRTRRFPVSHKIGFRATVRWPLEKVSPNAVEVIEEQRVDLVINIPKNYQETELTNDYYIRRKAVDFGIPLLTNIQMANRWAAAIFSKDIRSLTIKELQTY